MPSDNLFPSDLALANQSSDQTFHPPENHLYADSLLRQHMEGGALLATSPVKMADGGTPSFDWAKMAEEELNERPETVQDDIETLRSMVLAESNWHVRIDDEFLLRFLRARKFNCSKAFHMLQRYYVMKLRCPELFKVPRPSEKLQLLAMQAQNMLEDRDAHGRRVYIFRVDKCDAANVAIEDVFRTNVLALEHVVREPETQIAGLTVIVDMNGFGIPHAKFLSPYYSRRTVEVIQETFPLRFKGFHIVNQPFYFDAVFAVLRPFLKEKIRKRIYMHGRDLSALHAFVSPSILPVEYGGSKPPFDNTIWRQALLDDEDMFVELETYGYTQSALAPMEDIPIGDSA